MNFMIIREVDKTPCYHFVLPLCATLEATLVIVFIFPEENWPPADAHLLVQFGIKNVRRRREDRTWQDWLKCPGMAPIDVHVSS